MITKGRKLSQREQNRTSREIRKDKWKYGIGNSLKQNKNTATEINIPLKNAIRSSCVRLDVENRILKTVNGIWNMFFFSNIERVSPQDVWLLITDIKITILQSYNFLWAVSHILSEFAGNLLFYLLFH